jgi:copper chaperone CopZ
MKRTFKVDNVTCGGCANSIKVSLEDEFGNIEVNLDTNPKEVTLELKDDASLEAFYKEMDELGYPVIGEVYRKEL